MLINNLENLEKQLQTTCKTWLITSNASFISSNITEFLLKNGQKVVGLDNFSTGYRHNIDVYINGDGETSKDFIYIDNVIQMNVKAGLTDNVKAFGKVFNVAVGGRNTLNELYNLLEDQINQQSKAKNLSFRVEKEPIYRDFRPGDIRHSNADISKAKEIVGYEPTHDIYQGMQEAIEWHIDKSVNFKGF